MLLKFIVKKTYYFYFDFNIYIFYEFSFAPWWKTIKISLTFFL